MPTIIFAYNSSGVIPAPGANRVSYDIAWAKVTSIVNSAYHTLVDYAIERDVVSKTLRLEFKLGKQILTNPAHRAFFRGFFEAKYRWVVYGDFNNPVNVADDSLCKCEPPNENSDGGQVVDISMQQDQTGYVLLSAYEEPMTRINAIDYYLSAQIEIPADNDESNPLQFETGVGPLAVDGTGIAYPTFSFATNLINVDAILPDLQTAPIAIDTLEIREGHLKFKAAHANYGNPAKDGKYYAIFRISEQAI